MARGVGYTQIVGKEREIEREREREKGTVLYILRTRVDEYIYCGTNGFLTYGIN